jgi:DNA-binding CsgD family transcriptional regulator/sugar-specific transcriptional regulator TrmB
MKRHGSGKPSSCLTRGVDKVRQVKPRLGAVGVNPTHEQVYLHLIQEGQSRTVREVAGAVGATARVSREVLRALEVQGLVTRTATNPVSYCASPPELALETLVAQRDEELARIRLFAKELQTEFRESTESGGAADLIEVIVGQERVVRYYLHLMQGAKTEVSALTKPPYVAAQQTPEALDVEQACVLRGVRCRSVYDSEMFDEENTLDLVQRSIDLGEEARALGGLPMKLALFDRQAGFVPLKVNRPDLGVLVVHPSPLLDALIALFEAIWARAVPLRPSWTALPGDGLAAELDERLRQVLLLMSAGLKDESIARAMHTSRRTVQKHVTQLMSVLGARTRFQAALLARERGWVGAEPGLDRPVGGEPLSPRPVPH